MTFADDVLLLASFMDCDLRCPLETSEAECDAENGGLLNLGEEGAAATSGGCSGEVLLAKDCEIDHQLGELAGRLCMGMLR